MADPLPKSLSTSAQIVHILIIAGDHVEPEIMKESLRVLRTVEVTSQGRLKFELNHQSAGGCSIDEYGTPTTDEVLQMAKEESDAVLLGSIGGPEW